VHRTVSGAPNAPKDQWSDALEKEGDRAPDSYSDCPVVAPPVRGPTPGLSGAPHDRRQVGLSGWPPTAPSCLGAIKGTPRRMKELPKHSLNIIKHPDSSPTHLILCVSDLSWELRVLYFELKL
jgi:hypothetical protein